MQLVRAPSREVRTWTTDSRRWSSYVPREGDVIIATYPKCGTRRWQGVFRADDLALYREKLAAMPPACAAWLEHGGTIAA